MALDIRLRQIITKAAGIYFIVTDKSQVAAIEEESKLRVCFINTENGIINSLVKFAQGDIPGFNQIFGKSTRSKKKRGDFGHITCETMLESGPIGVINLRAFDDERDLTQVASINPNTKLPSGTLSSLIPYTSLFNRNGYWTPKPQNITDMYYKNTGYLNFGNIGINDVSLFVVKSTSTEVSTVTSEGNKTLNDTIIAIDDFPGLNKNMLLKDSFVTVFIFKNTFVNPTTNANYGYLFNQDGTISLENLRVLSTIRDSGFVSSYVGSVIPSLTSETQGVLSIDKVMFQDFMTTGIICDINTDLLESDLVSGNGMIDLHGYDSLVVNGSVSPNIPAFLSYKAKTLTMSPNVGTYPPQDREDLKFIPNNWDLIPYQAVPDPESKIKFRQTVDQGLIIGDSILGQNGIVNITGIEVEPSISEVKVALANYNHVKIVFGNNRYYNVTNQKWLQSKDGIDWKVIPNTFDTVNNYQLHYIDAVFSNRLIALAHCPGDACNYIVTFDGNNVSFTKLQVINPLTNLVFGNGKYIAYNTDTIVTSSDGINWSVQSNIFNGNVDRITFIPGASSYSFLGTMSADGHSNLYHSKDGTSWNMTNTLPFAPDPIIGITSTKSNVYVFRNMQMFRCPISQLNSGTWDMVPNPNPPGSQFYSSDHNIIRSSMYGDIFIACERSNNPTPPPSYVSKQLHEFNWVNLNIPNLSLPGRRVSLVKNSELFIYQFSSEYFCQWIEDDIHGNINNLNEGTFSENYTFTYTPAVFTASGPVQFNDIDIPDPGNPSVILYTATSCVRKIVPFVTQPNTVLTKFTLQSYKPVEDQFLNGTSQRQNEILNMMNDPGIVKGLVGTVGCRYFVDGFKSFLESDYKYQYRDLVERLNENNKFTTAILNEPFMTDFNKSTNPMFKQFPNQSVINFEYIPEGGNKQYSTKLLQKIDNQFCFFFGPGNIVNGINETIAGRISNLFYKKRFPFDIVANTTGYLSGITELEEAFSDNDRKYLEQFRYNPVIYFNRSFTIFGNLSSQKQMSKQQQIHNVELLQYIRENLYHLAKGDTFKKGSYDEYLRSQTEIQNFMDTLVLVGAINPNPIVQCDLGNNTEEVQNYRIKVVKVEYTPYNCIEKVVFDLNIF